LNYIHLSYVLSIPKKFKPKNKINTRY